MKEVKSVTYSRPFLVDENNAKSVSRDSRKPVICTGSQSNVITQNANAPIVVLGCYSHGITNGLSSRVAVISDFSMGVSKHDYSHVSNLGNYGRARTNGYISHAVGCGINPKVDALGEQSIAAALGFNGIASAGVGGMMIFACYDSQNNCMDAKVGRIGVDEDSDGDVLEPFIRYRLNFELKISKADVRSEHFEYNNENNIEGVHQGFDRIESVERCCDLLSKVHVLQSDARVD